MLSAKTHSSSLDAYYHKHHEKQKLNIDDYAKRSIGVRLALQKSKDEKLKVQKVIASNKQSEQTKMEYLMLKRRDIEDEIGSEIKSIYNEFFRREYEEAFGGEAFEAFQEKIRHTMNAMHKHLLIKE